MFEMRPIADIRPDRACFAGTFDLPACSGDRKGPDPRNIAGEVGQVLIAGRRLERHGDEHAGHDLQKCAHRGDRFLLSFCALPRQFDDLCWASAVRWRGRIQAMDPLEHQRCDGQKREHDEACANTQDRLLRCAGLSDLVVRLIPVFRHCHTLCPVPQRNRQG